MLLRHFDIAFDEVMVRFDGFSADSRFKRRIAEASPAGRVPVLIDDGLVVWDTLAIAEYLAEKFPSTGCGRVMGVSAHERGRCAPRCTLDSRLCAAIARRTSRRRCPRWVAIVAEQAAVRDDLARVGDMWTQALSASGGPFLFGAFGIVDAYYAPVAGRIRTYRLPVSPTVAAYIDRVFSSPGVAAWVGDALAEAEFLGFEEPYRSARN